MRPIEGSWSIVLLILAVDVARAFNPVLLLRPGHISSFRRCAAANHVSLQGSMQGSLESGDLDDPIDQNKAPVVDTLEKAASLVRSPFFFPGHRMGKGASEKMLKLMPEHTFRMDIPEDVEGLDCLCTADGPIGCVN
jgi:hypothetical protein